jgi:hypothetical protein
MQTRVSNLISHMYIACNRGKTMLTRNVVVRNTMPPNAPLWLFFLPLTFKDDLDLSPLKMCSSMRYTCMPNIKLLRSILQKLWRRLKFWLKFLNYFFWPLTLKDDLDFDLSPLKMCSSMRYTCMPKIKLLCSILQKLIWRLKFWLKFWDTHTHTHMDTYNDRQAKNNIPPIFRSGGIKIILVVFFKQSSYNKQV